MILGLLLVQPLQVNLWLPFTVETTLQDLAGEGRTVIISMGFVCHCCGWLDCLER